MKRKSRSKEPLARVFVDLHRTVMESLSHWVGIAEIDKHGGRITVISAFHGGLSALSFIFLNPALGSVFNLMSRQALFALGSAQGRITIKGHIHKPQEHRLLRGTVLLLEPTDSRF